MFLKHHNYVFENVWFQQVFSDKLFFSKKWWKIPQIKLLIDVNCYVEDWKPHKLESILSKAAAILPKSLSYDVSVSFFVYSRIYLYITLKLGSHINRTTTISIFHSLERTSYTQIGKIFHYSIVEVVVLMHISLATDTKNIADLRSSRRYFLLSM